MAEKNNDRLFFTCSLIEFMGRRLKKKQGRDHRYSGKRAAGTDL